MKTKNLFLTTILVVFGAINENIAQTSTYSEPAGSVGNGGYYNTYLGYGAGSFFGNQSWSTNNSNVAVGMYAGSKLEASGNCFLGWGAGEKTVNGGNNVFMGASSGNKNISGQNNVFIGTQSGIENISGIHNVFLGSQAGFANLSGKYNTFLGNGSGAGSVSGEYNTAVGVNSGVKLAIGKDNSSFGNHAAASSIEGDGNTCIGHHSGEGLIDGSNNTFLGYVNVAGNKLISNTIVLADGLGAQRFYIHSNGYAGIGLGNNVIPKNRLEIVSGATNSGLRFRDMTNVSTSITNPTNSVLSVNAKGDVILVYDKQGTGSGPATTITAGQNIVVTGDSTAGYTISGSTSNALANNTNTITSTVNGISANAPIVNTVVNTITSGQLITTVNGVASTPVTLPTSGSGTDTSIYANDGTIDVLTTSTADNIRTVNMGNTNLFFNTFGSAFTDGTKGFGRIYIGNSTNFPILTSNANNTSHYRLLVEGGILTEKVKVALRNPDTNWADYVFAKDYKLMPLKEVETYVRTNKHLPGVSSAEDLVKNGLDLGEMQSKQMEKIEELTLYAIEQDKQIEKLSKEMEELKVLVKTLANKNK